MSTVTSIGSSIGARSHILVERIGLYRPSMDSNYASLAFLYCHLKSGVRFNITEIKIGKTPSITARELTEYNGPTILKIQLKLGFMISR